MLVEGPSKSAARRAAAEDADGGPAGPKQLTGRTHCDRIVVFEGPERLVGQLAAIAIEDASPVTLFGRVVTTDSRP